MSLHNTFRIPNALQRALKAIGVDPAALLRKSGLPLTLWTTDNGMVTTEQWFGLWRALQELSDDPATGLKLPAGAPVEQHHPMSIAARHARTFRDALQRLARYKILCCAEEMLVVEGKEECRVGFNWMLSREFAPPLLIDAAFSSTLDLGRRGTGKPLRALRLELARKEDHREMYEAHFGCPMKFNARRNAIFFRASDLDLPFINYNAELLAMLGPQLDRELARRKTGQTLAARVRWIVTKLLGGHPPGILTVARELGMSSRTLQRRITKEGTSFRALLNEARRELARHYLQQSSLELRETACLLGYQDPNSFFRAFREWEGMTPGEWKAIQNGKATAS